MEPNPNPTDIVVYIALSEEFIDVKKELGSKFKPLELSDVAITYFHRQLQSKISQRTFNIVVIPAGKMGNTRSGNIMATIIEKFRPLNVVVVGIAGSLSNDLQPGDVFIPDSVNEYLANAAAIGDNEWDFETSGNHFTTDPRLLNRFQLFSVTQKKYFNSWKRKASKDLSNLITERVRLSLKDAGLEMRKECNLYAGDDKVLASGPVVGKGKAFVEWLKKKIDRKMTAIEMESAGVYDASIMRTPSPRAIAIRGISDFADERKQKLETLTNGSLRSLAIKNAMSLLLAAVKAGLFKGQDGLIQPFVSTKPFQAESLPKYVVRQQKHIKKLKKKY